MMNEQMNDYPPQCVCDGSGNHLQLKYEANFSAPCSNSDQTQILVLPCPDPVLLTT